MKKIFLLLLFITSFLLADDIVLKNGTVFKNVKITGETATGIIIKMTTGERTIEKDAIDRIIQIPFDEKTASLEIKPPKKTGITDIRYITVPLAVVAGYLAYDSFRDLSKLEKDIERLSNTNQSAKDQISEKNVKTALGLVFTAVAIASIYFTFEPFSISASSNQINFRYGF